MAQTIITDDFSDATHFSSAVAQGPTSPGTFTAGPSAVPPNTGQITVPAGHSGTFVANTNMPVDDVLSPHGPSCFVYLEFDNTTLPNPSAGGSYNNIWVGIGIDGQNNWGREGGSTPNPTLFGSDILAFTGGSQSDIDGINLTVPPLPDAWGFQIVGNDMVAGVRVNGSWIATSVASPFPAYDFTASGALTGMYAAIALNGGGSAYGVTYTAMGIGPPIFSLLPNVVGMSNAAAQAAIISAGFVVGTITPVISGLPQGQVLFQTLAPGYQLTGATVSLSEAQSATGTVPNVVNTGFATTAPGILEAAGFQVGVVTYAPSVLIIPGNIISQNPAAGSPGILGNGVDLVVSTGRAGVFVPYIIDSTPDQANTAILDIGLVTGAVSFAPSLSIPAGEIIAQNPQGGTPVASGALVSYIVSSGPPIADDTFDFEATIISQYANSPTIQQLVASMNGYIDQAQNFANFYNFVWNVDTAQGFGLDVWGKIVNVSRLLQIPTTAVYVGFQDGSSSGPGPGWDVQPFSAGGTWYDPNTATEAYLLEDEPYRQLILTKALANIVNTTVPAFNQLLQNLFPGRGNPYVVTSGLMAMTFVFDFDLTPIELAILQQSGAVPVPPGVSFTIVVP